MIKLQDALKKAHRLEISVQPDAFGLGGHFYLTVWVKSSPVVAVTYWAGRFAFLQKDEEGRIAEITLPASVVDNLDLGWLRNRLAEVMAKVAREYGIYGIPAEDNIGISFGDETKDHLVHAAAVEVGR